MYNGQATYTVEASGEESAVDSALAHWRNASSNTTCTKFEQVVRDKCTATLIENHTPSEEEA